MKTKLLGYFMICLSLFVLAGCSATGEASTETLDDGVPTTVTTTLSGILTTEDGSAMANADVTLSQTTTSGISGKLSLNSASALTTRTDEEGAFTFSNVPIGVYVLEATDETGYRIQKSGITLGESTPANLGTLVVKRAGDIFGEVNLSDSDSHIGIDVFIPGTTYAAKTSEAGTYVISNIPAGTYDIFAYKVGYELGYEEDIEVVRNMVTTADLITITAIPDEVEEAETGSITGVARLSDAETHTGIQVFVPGTSAVALTASDGSYTFSNLLPGTYTVMAMYDDYSTQTLTGKVVAAGATTNVTTMTLTRIPEEEEEAETGSITGVARLSDVETHTGIQVFIPGTSAVALTASDGSYTFSNLLPGTYTVMAMYDDYSTQTLTGKAVTAGSTTNVTTMTLTPSVVETLGTVITDHFRDKDSIYLKLSTTGGTPEGYWVYTSSDGTDYSSDMNMTPGDTYTLDNFSTDSLATRTNYIRIAPIVPGSSAPISSAFTFDTNSDDPDLVISEIFKMKSGSEDKLNLRVTVSSGSASSYFVWVSSSKNDFFDPTNLILSGGAVSDLKNLSMTDLDTGTYYVRVQKSDSGEAIGHMSPAVTLNMTTSEPKVTLDSVVVNGTTRKLSFVGSFDQGSATEFDILYSTDDTDFTNASYLTSTEASISIADISDASDITIKTLAEGDYFVSVVPKTSSGERGRYSNPVSFEYALDTFTHVHTYKMTEYINSISFEGFSPPDFDRDTIYASVQTGSDYGYVEIVPENSDNDTDPSSDNTPSFQDLDTNKVKVTKSDGDIWHVKGGTLYRDGSSINLGASYSNLSSVETDNNRDVYVVDYSTAKLIQYDTSELSTDTYTFSGLSGSPYRLRIADGRAYILTTQSEIVSVSLDVFSGGSADVETYSFASLSDLEIQDFATDGESLYYLISDAFSEAYVRKVALSDTETTLETYDFSTHSTDYTDGMLVDDSYLYIAEGLNLYKFVK